MPAPPTRVLLDLLTFCPELQPFCDEHLRAWGEEAEENLHMVMMELELYVHALHRVHVLTNGILSDQARNLLVRILGFLETCPESPDYRIRDAVRLSFLQGFEVEEEFFSRFEPLMGPKLHSAWLSPGGQTGTGLGG